MTTISGNKQVWLVQH